MMKKEELHAGKGSPFAEGNVISNRGKNDLVQIEAVIAQCDNVRNFISQNYKMALHANQQLAEAYDDLEVFSYSISHDLRAPLRTIEAYTDILNENYQTALGAEGLQILGNIKDSAAKLNELISGLLAYARAGKKDLILNEIPLREAVIAEAEPLMAEAQRQGRRVELKLLEGLPNVMADKPAFNILIKNLLSNAFKYTANAAVAIIEIGGEQASGSTMFYVKDNGIGLEMEHAERAFGVFSRLVNEEQFEGSGIGLALVKRIVEKHGGTVSVKSQKGQGSIFFVELPIRVEDILQEK